MEELKEEIQSLNMEELEEKMFRERKQMVEFAEENGQWQLFDDQQSIGSMRKAIEQMPESEIKTEIRRRFNRVELMYDKYTTMIVEDTVQ